MSASLHSFTAHKISRQSVSQEIAFLEEMNAYYLNIIFQAQSAHIENHLRLQELKKCQNQN